MDKPISNFDILEKLKGNTRLIFYEDLNNIDNIIPLLDKGSLVILYKSKPDYGHWTALVKTPEGIEYFDSYGDKPEYAKKGANRKFLIETSQYTNQLARLLLEASRVIPINFNNHRLQRLSKSIATCGKHVIIRILNRNLTTDQYNNSLRKLAKKNKITTDQLVNLLYNSIK